MCIETKLELDLDLGHELSAGAGGGTHGLYAFPSRPVEAGSRVGKPGRTCGLLNDECMTVLEDNLQPAELLARYVTVCGLLAAARRSKS